MYIRQLHALPSFKGNMYIHRMHAAHGSHQQAVCRQQAAPRNKLETRETSNHRFTAETCRHQWWGRVGTQISRTAVTRSSCRLLGQNKGELGQYNIQLLVTAIREWGVGLGSRYNLLHQQQCMVPQLATSFTTSQKHNFYNGLEETPQCTMGNSQCNSSSTIIDGINGGDKQQQLRLWPRECNSCSSMASSP
jgi:hypothetical protein